MKNWKYINGAEVGNTKVKKTLFKSLATPTTWTPGINGRPITGAPEFKGTFAKDEADKWTDKWIKDHGFEAENKTGNSSIGNSAYDDGVKKGKEDKRKGKLITAAGFDMHVPNFSKYSYQEKEEFKKGYYSSNDLTKDDIYKSWKTGNSDGVARMFQGLVKDENKEVEKDSGAIDDLEKVGNKYKPGDEVTVRLPGKGARRALVVRDEGNVIKVAFSEDGPEVTVLPNEVSNSKTGNGRVGNTSINELQAFLDQYGTGASLSQMISMATRKFGDFSILNDRYLVDQKSGNTYQLIKSAAQGKYVAKKIFNSNVGNKGRINYDDDLVIVKHNGTVTYKGLEDYEPDKYAPWKYNESKGIYELPDGWTKEKVGNSKVGNVQFAGDYYDIVQENPEEFYIYLNGGARRYGPYRTKAAAEIELKKILDRRNRIGNSYSDKLPTAMDYRKALDEIIEKKNLNPDEARRKYGQFTYAQWEKELGHKIGNSEDDKFAYVMREFEEGKLKSSSGETVTDPAQAKAIAYSESKKAENGLTRARKAIH